MAKPTAIVYVDGLNLYRQCLSSKPDLKWLDLQKLFEVMLPTHEITLIRYFTARIKPPIGNESAPIRQNTYLRGLAAHTKSVQMHFGQIRSDTKQYRKVPLELDSSGRPVLAKVQKLEEKGTDVSLSNYMVLDACRSQADLFVLVSSDSDFVSTIKILRSELHVRTAISFPSRSPAKSLLATKPTLIKVIREDLLEQCQLPFEIVTKNGAIQLSLIHI
jgi:uncharacterized LabA/DUF88 family protein